MDISISATSEILTMRIFSRKGMPHEDSAGLGKMVHVFYCLKESCVALLSHYLFHLNISCDYELYKVRKGFSY